MAVTGGIKFDRYISSFGMAMGILFVILGFYFLFTYSSTYHYVFGVIFGIIYLVMAFAIVAYFTRAVFWEQPVMRADGDEDGIAPCEEVDLAPISRVGMVVGVIVIMLAIFFTMLNPESFSVFLLAAAGLIFMFYFAVFQSTRVRDRRS